MAVAMARSFEYKIKQPWELRSREEIRDLQWKKLEKQIDYNYSRSPFYRELMDGAGIKPQDVRSWEDFQQIPTWNKDVQRQIQTKGAEEYGDPLLLRGLRRQRQVPQVLVDFGDNGGAHPVHAHEERYSSDE